MLFDRNFPGAEPRKLFRKITKHKRRFVPDRIRKTALVFIMHISLALSALAISLVMCAQNSALYLEIQEKVNLFDGENAPERSSVIRMNENIAAFLSGKQACVYDASMRAQMHMRDVLNIFEHLKIAGGISFAVFGACVFGIRKNKIRYACLWGMLPPGLFLTAVIFFRLTNFKEVFLLFHTLAFSNNLWLLNPEEDFLIRCLPEAFFYKMTLSALWRAVAVYALFWGVTTVTIKMIGRRDQDEVY